MGFKKKILVVEDSKIQRTICVSQLKQAGYENIEIAEDGVHAYSKLEKISIDLIICDWEMPELDGIQLLKKVKKNPALQNIPFVMLTFFDDDEHYREAMNAGAQDYIIKPASPDLLKEKLEKID